MNASGRAQQPRLLSTDNPLTARFGGDFFKAIPASPGVYSFYDAEGTLLYIGQSHDLRARIGSYRHVSPERHPKRTLRLVHRIASVDWQECLDREQALELERVLLLEKRPPFNRAGVWPGSPWWFGVQVGQGSVEVQLSRQPMPALTCTGPLASAFRYVHASLMRCTFRLLHPGLPLSEYPLGLLNHTIPLSLCLVTPDAEELAGALTLFAAGEGGGFLSRLEAIAGGASPLEQEFWMSELDGLRKHAAKKRVIPELQDTAALTPLPLFEGL